jgi:3',5'-nucleoside bisphosphate phosphatase
MRYDLHTHSRHSDGAFSPAEVVAKAKDAGLDGIALTDHDCTDGYDEARTAGETLGIDVLLGCELSASFRGVGIHMLSYLIDPQHPRWIEEMRTFQDDRSVRAERTVAKLQELGVPVTIEQVRAIAGEGSIGRPHLAQALVDAGVIATTPEAFTDEWIGDGGRAYVGRTEVLPDAAVALTRAAGGVAVIAHPIWIEREAGDAFEEIFEACVAAGVAGLEVAHPDHDPDTRRRFTALAEKHDLIPTGSSDFHGNAHGGRLGAHTVGEDIIAALRAHATTASGV